MKLGTLYGIELSRYPMQRYRNGKYYILTSRQVHKMLPTGE